MTEAGYSGSSLVRKLGVKPGSRVTLVGAPEGFEDTLVKLPSGVSISRRLRESSDVIVAFNTPSAELKRRLPALRSALAYDGGLWLVWPKRASGIDTDLGEGIVREHGLAHGLVDNKICAIDQTWSGLRFVYRLGDRPRAST
ncbi:MAG: DUF3052 domain-containing protein [Solirubrobacteraceae bacterium]